MARGRKSSLIVILTVDESDELRSWIRSNCMRAGLVRRARIIVLRAEGQSISEIARTVGIRWRFVEKWIKRFLCHRIDGLGDQAGRGRKPVFSP
jgi:hypothetical protein